MLKNYYNPPPLAKFLICTTHCVGAIKINRKETHKQLKELQKAKVIVQHSSTTSPPAKFKKCSKQIQLWLVSHISNVHVKALTHHTSSDKIYIKTLNVCQYTHFFLVFHNSSLQTPQQTCNSVWLFTRPSKFTIIILPFKAK